MTAEERDLLRQLEFRVDSLSMLVKLLIESHGLPKLPKSLVQSQRRALDRTIRALGTRVRDGVR